MRMFSSSSFAWEENSFLGFTCVHLEVNVEISIFLFDEKKYTND